MMGDGLVPGRASRGNKDANYSAEHKANACTRPSTQSTKAEDPRSNIRRLALFQAARLRDTYLELTNRE